MLKICTLAVERPSASGLICKLAQRRTVTSSSSTSATPPTTDDGELTSKPSTSIALRSIDDKRREMLDRIIRVDHAGELGADRIYAGQMFVLGGTSVGRTIKHMWEQEKEHLETFEKLIPKYRARPTALLPLWNIAGFVLGATTAMLGKEGAMACTVAVEEVIADHYNNQIREMLEDNPTENKELLDVVKKFRDDEMEHHDTGLAHDALNAPFYNVLKQTIQFGCKGAIWISERI